MSHRNIPFVSGGRGVKARRDSGFIGAPSINPNGALVGQTGVVRGEGGRLKPSVVSQITTLVISRSWTEYVAMTNRQRL